MIKIYKELMSDIGVPVQGTEENPIIVKFKANTERVENGVITYSMVFYANEEVMKKYRPFIPIRPENGFEEIRTYTYKLKDDSEKVHLSPVYISKWLSEYLETVFSCYFELENEEYSREFLHYEQLHSELGITGNKDLTFNLPAKYKIDKIQVKEVGGESAVDVKFGSTSGSDDIKAATTVGISETVEITPDIDFFSDEADTDIFISSDAWVSAEVEVKVKFRLNTI